MARTPQRIWEFVMTQLARARGRGSTPAAGVDSGAQGSPGPEPSAPPDATDREACQGDGRGLLLGNQTAFSASDLLDPYRFARAQGWHAFEWFPDRRDSLGWVFSDLDPELRRRLRAEAEAAGLSFSVHAPCETDPRTPQGLQDLSLSIELAQDLGARLLVIHLPAPQELAAWVAALHGLLVASGDLVLAFENTEATGPADCNRALEAVLDAGAAPGKVGLCFDLGHANLCAATRNDYLRFMDELDPGLPIVHVHLHENWGELDEHLVLFTGPAGKDDRGVYGLLERLRRRNYRGAFIFEQWPRPPELLLLAAGRLNQLAREVGLVPA